MAESKFICDCSGCVAPNGICGYIMCSSKDCGAPDDMECEHKVIKIVGVNDQEE